MAGRKPMSDEHKAKISAALKGRPSNNPHGNGGATKGRKATGRQLEGLRAGWEKQRLDPHPVSDESRAKMRAAKLGKNRGADHRLWAGDNVGYGALHVWVARNFLDPGACETCGTSELLQWASIDHRYTRNREDWMRLCTRCHFHMDHPDGLDPELLSAAGKRGAAARWNKEKASSRE